MYRQHLLQALRERINELVPEIKHVALWNQDVYFADEDTWATPALFLEFGNIEWMPTKSFAYRGTGDILLHIVTEYPTTQEHLPYSLADVVTSALMGLEGDDFRITALASSLTNHDHEQLEETIETMKAKFSRQLPLLIERNRAYIPE